MDDIIIVIGGISEFFDGLWCAFFNGFLIVFFHDCWLMFHSFFLWLFDCLNNSFWWFFDGVWWSRVFDGFFVYGFWWLFNAFLMDFDGFWLFFDSFWWFLMVFWMLFVAHLWVLKIPFFPACDARDAQRQAELRRLLGPKIWGECHGFCTGNYAKLNGDCCIPSGELT